MREKNEKLYRWISIGEDALLFNYWQSWITTTDQQTDN